MFPSLPCRVLPLFLLLQASARAATPPGLPEPGAPDATALEAANAAIGPAFKAQRWDEVLELGKRAYAAGGAADALETIAVAALRLGHANLAFGAYEAIAADVAAPAKTLTRAHNQLQALKSQVATIALTTSPEGARVEIRGVGAGTSPLPSLLRTFPGKVEVAATFADGVRVTRMVDAKVGPTLSVTLTEPHANSPAPAVVVPAAPSPPTAPLSAAPATHPSAAPATPPSAAPAPPPSVAAPPLEVPPEVPPRNEPPQAGQLEKPEAVATSELRWAAQSGWAVFGGLHVVSLGIVGPGRMASVSSDCGAGQGIRTTTASTVEVIDAGAGVGLGARVGPHWSGFDAEGPRGSFWSFFGHVGADLVALGAGVRASLREHQNGCFVQRQGAEMRWSYAIHVPLSVGAQWSLGSAGPDETWSGWGLGVAFSPAFQLEGANLSQHFFSPLGVEVSGESLSLKAGSRSPQIQFGIGLWPSVMLGQAWTGALRGGVVWR